MSKKKKSSEHYKSYKPGRGSLSPAKSILAQRSIFRAEDHDTTLKTRTWLITHGYVRPGDSQYDAALDPVAVARKEARATARATRAAEAGCNGVVRSIDH
jgi:hypothetical protein